MTTYGVSTTLGFRLKQLRDIKASLQTLLIQVQDPTTGETLNVNLDDDDPFVQIINIMIDDLTTCWELLETCYNQFNPLLASGPSLKGLVQLNGITAKPGTPSTVVLTLSGTVGVIVPIGSQATDANNTVIWETLANATIGSGGTITVNAQSTTNGAFVYAAGTINKMATITTGWNAVVNTSSSVAGTADEADVPLRQRRKISTTTPAQSIPEAIYSAILNVTGVTQCRLYINNDLIPDAYSIPPKTIAAVVQGGDDQDITDILFTRKGGGVKTYGNTSKTYTDAMGVSETIYFTRPTAIPIYVRISITILDASTFPVDGEAQIKENIVLFSLSGASGIGITENLFEQTGFLPGESVVASVLYTPVNVISGLKINSLQISSDGVSFSTNDIAILWNSLATFSTDNIGITIA